MNAIRILVVIALIAAAAVRRDYCFAQDTSKTNYHITKEYSIPTDGSWDYVSIDSSARRLYVSHGSELNVLDADSGKAVGTITETPGIHGTAIASDLNRGFTSNGKDSTVTVFDLRTLKVLGKVDVNRPDFILYDSFTKRVFPLSGRTTVIDASSQEKVGELDLVGDPEAAVSDGKGTIYVNLKDKDEVAVIDAQGLSVRRRYALEACHSPHSLAIDADSERLFVGCRDGLAVLDANNGRQVGWSLICGGVDAGGFDKDRGLIFESCAEGVVSVIKQFSADSYLLVQTVQTHLYAGTMALDAKTKKLFLPTAEFVVVHTNGGQEPIKRQLIPGTFRVLVAEP